MKKLKNIILLLTVFCSAVFAQPEYSEIGSMPGAFSRMGFGARGMGMGNALSSIKDGNISTYYNPALAAFQEGNLFQTSYSFLSLDRSLNFVNCGRKFELGTKQMPDGTIKPRSIAGINIGLINAGVSDIGAYDNQGNKYDDLSTSENQFYAAVSNRFSDKLAIGIAFKFYYYKLYEEVTSTSLGFDIGALYSFNDALTFSFVLSDINSKYNWDTGKIYGQSGKITKDKFPLLKKFGASYNFKEQKIIAALEIESSNAGTNFIRGGAEYNIYTDLFLRAGFDKFNLSNSDFPVRPSFGFSYFYNVASYKLGVDYAFVIEPYSSSDQHIVGINFNF